MLSRKDILGLPDVGTIATFPVPELGGDVGLIEFSADQADALAKGLGNDDNVPFNVRVVVTGACDDKGAPLFTEADIPALRKKKNKFVQPLASAILDHNAMSKASQDELKNDSSETLSDGSASASQDTSGEPLPS